MDTLNSLHDKSLLRREDSRDAPRYRMLETIREYAWERLAAAGEAEEMQRSHAAYYLSLAEQAELELKGPRQAAWLDRLEAEHDNLRSALRFCRETGDAEMGLRLAGALWRFWLVHGYLTEGRELLVGMLASSSESRNSGLKSSVDAATDRGLEAQNAALAKALSGVGVLATTQGDYVAARAYFEESLGIYRELGDLPGTATLLSNLGHVTRAQGDYSGAHSLYEESLAMWQQLGSKADLAAAFGNLGNILLDLGKYAEARSLHEQSVQTFRELDNKWAIATGLNNMAVAAEQQEDFPSAHALFSECLVIRRELGDRRGIAAALNNLGSVSYHLREYDVAQTLYTQSLKMRQELGDKRGMALCLEGLASTVRAQGRTRHAVRLMGAAEALREAIGAALLPTERADHDRDVAAARARLGQTSFSEAWDEGHVMILGEQGLEQAVAYVLGLAGRK